MSHRSVPWRLLALPGLAWLAVFFLVAFYAIIAVAFGNVSTLYEPLPHWNPLDWNVGYVGAALDDLLPGGDQWDVFVRTLLYVAAAVAVSMVIAFPVAWFAARHAGRWKGAVLIALALPFWISYLMRMFAWTNLLESGGYGADLLHALSFDRLFDSLGLMEGTDWLAGQHISVVMALVYGYVPYLILVLYATLDRIDQRLIESARDLGAPPIAAFWRVVVPLARPGMLAGIVVIALPMFGDFYTPDLISGSPRTSMLGNTINGYVQGGPDKALGAALTLVLSAFLLVLMLWYIRTLRTAEREAMAT
jgi:spermidine/putrescine transport system permease protein